MRCNFLTGIPAITLFALLSLGCTHSHYLKKERYEKDFQNINALATNHESVIISTRGSSFRAKQMHISPDSISWMDAQTLRDKTMDIGEIAEIKFVRHGKGALEGMGAGFLVGASIGAMVGLLSGDDEPSPGATGWNFEINFTKEQKALMGGAGLGGLFMAVGLAAGAANGSTDHFIFEHSQALPDTLRSPRPVAEKHR